MNKSIASLLLVSGLLAGLASAETVAKGKRSLGFDANGSDNSRLIEGALFISDDISLRAAVAFYDSDSEEELALGVGIQRHFSSETQVTPFIGARFLLAKSDGEKKVGDDYSGYYSESYESESLIIQLYGGFEYFFTDNIGLFVKAGVSVSTEDDGGEGGDEEVISTFNSGSGYGVGAGLNIYF